MDAIADLSISPPPPATMAPAASTAGRLRRRGGGGGGGRLLFSLVDQASVSGTNFATGIIIGRACTKEEFGLYGMALAGLLLLTEVQHALISTPHQVLYPKAPDLAGRRRFNGSTLIHTLGVGLLAGVGLTLAGGIEAIGGPQGVARVLLALAVVAWAVLARYFARVFCFTTLRPTRALIVDVTIAVVQLSLLIALAWTGHLSATTAVLAIGAANALALVGWFAAARSDFTFDLRLAADDLRRTWPLSRWMFISGLLWSAGIHTYPWLVGSMRSAAEAGVWTACFGIAALANPLLMGISNVLGPAVAHAHAQRSAVDFRRYVVRAAAAFALLMLPFVLVAGFGGEWILKLYGGQYAGYGAIVGLIAIAMLTQAIGFTAARGLFALGHAEQDMIGNIVTIALLVGGLWLIHRYGLPGAALSLIVSTTAGNVYRFIAFLHACRPTLAGGVS